MNSCRWPTGRTSRPTPLDALRPRVLLVDDDERNLLAVANVLDDLGEVVLARSGEEALRHLLKGEFAVILLDVYMPGMDGYETAQIIRKREQTKGIPDRLPVGGEQGNRASPARLFDGCRRLCVQAGRSRRAALEGRRLRRPFRQDEGDRAESGAGTGTERGAFARGAGASPRGAAAGGDHPVAAHGALPRTLRGGGPLAALCERRLPGDHRLHAGRRPQAADNVGGPASPGRSRRGPRHHRSATDQRPLIGRVSLAERRRHLPPLPRPGGSAQGQRRAPDGVRRHADRHHRAALAREPAYAGAEDGRHRQADGRHRARFQQSARCGHRRPWAAREARLAGARRKPASSA